MKIQKDVQLLEDDHSFVLKKIEEFVLSNKGQNLSKMSNKISFNISLFGWSWDYFSLIDKGYFVVEHDKIIFGFSLYKRLIITLIICPLIIFSTKNVYAFFPFIAMLALNYLIAYLKYKSMLKNSIGVLTR